MNQLHKRNVEGILGELEQENRALINMDTELTTNTTDSIGGSEDSSSVDGKDIMMSTVNPGTTFNTTSTTAYSTFASHLDDTSRLTADSGGYSPSPPIALFLTGPSPLVAILWSSQRALLDKQEAVMLSRIRELREKVASQMKINAKQSSSSAP